MTDSCPFCDSEEIDDNDLDDSSCTCYESELGTLVRLQEAIKRIDVSERPFPMSISFSTTGQVLVNHSLSPPIFFKTIDDALKYINDEINELKGNSKMSYHLNRYTPSLTGCPGGEEEGRVTCIIEENTIKTV